MALGVEHEGGDGRQGEPVVTASSGTVPFGFGFGRRGEVIVSEAGASTVSSYRIAASGALAAITPSLAVNQGAACWLAVSPNGRFAYTGNATGSISGFQVAARNADFRSCSETGLVKCSSNPASVACKRSLSPP